MRILDYGGGDGSLLRAAEFAILALDADRGVRLLEELSRLLRESIDLGLRNREEATTYALGFARDLEPETADRFIEMYVNELTCDYGDEGRQAVAELLRRAEAAGAYERPVKVDFVS